MPFTSSGIEYAELDVRGSMGYRENWQGRDAVLTRYADQVPWAAGQQFVIDMKGLATQQGVFLTRILPDLHPFYLTPTPWVVCDDVEMIDAYGDGQPTQNALGNIYYTNARYRLGYRRIKWNCWTDSQVASYGTSREIMRFVERKGKFSSRNLQIPGGGFKTSSGTQLATVGVKTITVETLEMKWLGIPKIPYNVISMASGRVNSAPFDTSYGNDPAQTVLFEDADWEEFRQMDGTPGYDMTYRFSIRKNQDASGNRLTWNQVPDKTGNVWVNIVSVVDGTTPLYLTFDLNLLFSYYYDL